MATTFGNTNVHSTTETKTAAPSTFWEEMEQSRFGLIPIILLVIGILGGIAAGFAVGLGAWQLMTIVFPTMISLCMILAVAPMKVILRVSALAVAVDLIFVLTYSFI